MNAHEHSVRQFLQSVRQRKARDQRQKLKECVARIAPPEKHDDVRRAVEYLTATGFQVLGAVKSFNFVEIA